MRLMHCDSIRQLLMQGTTAQMWQKEMHANRKPQSRATGIPKTADRMR